MKQGTKSFTDLDYAAHQESGLPGEDAADTLALHVSQEEVQPGVWDQNGSILNFKPLWTIPPQPLISENAKHVAKEFM